MCREPRRGAYHRAARTGTVAFLTAGADSGRAGPAGAVAGAAVGGDPAGAAPRDAGGAGAVVAVVPGAALVIGAANLAGGRAGDGLADRAVAAQAAALDGVGA